ncbi:MAG: hypothetical protein AAGA71_21490 [Pseudomonadota bacterium]
MLGAPLCEASCHLPVAARACYEPAQWELENAVFPDWRQGFPAELILNALPIGEVDQRLVLAFEHVQIPLGNAHVAGIDRVLENAFGFVELHFAVLVARERRVRLQESLHLGDGRQAPVGEAQDCLLHDGCQRLVADEHTPNAFHGVEAVANWRIEEPVPGPGARLHLLDGLASVLLALQLALRSDDGFDEFAFGGVLEAEVETLRPSTAGIERPAQRPVEFCIAGKALEIVEDHDEALVRLGIEKAQERDHTRALHEVAAARGVVWEDTGDLVSLVGCIVAAAGFLAFQPVAVCCLFRRGDAAVDNGICRLGHRVLLSIGGWSLKSTPVAFLKESEHAGAPAISCAESRCRARSRRTSANA